ncbi:MAG: von Willebrand factor type A domain-containing protein [Woeseiaceae bacterium]
MRVNIGYRAIGLSLVLLAVGCTQSTVGPEQANPPTDAAASKDSSMTTRPAQSDDSESKEETLDDTRIAEVDLAESRENEAAPSVLPERNRVVVAEALYAAESKRLGQLSGAGHYSPPQTMPIPENRENYATLVHNRINIVTESPVSTFSIDVDTGSYANVRRMLREGRLPPRDAVRTEELINYFNYAYQRPESVDAPFHVVREMAPSPWNPANTLLHIGVQGFVPELAEQVTSNLVFLLDVSGSMNSQEKLGLLKYALKQLAGQLDADDRVSIVVYAGASGVVLEPTPGDQFSRIAGALDRLQAGGSTNGGAGIQLAYAMAEKAFMPNGINRVILATDGDFNVGTTGIDALKNLVAEKRERGIALTTLGFGTGNYNDALMEQIADVGNGNYAYIDTPQEARKVLVEELSATMLTIAQDVKVQVEFNPAVVSEYRLIGYENRLLNREDFNNDKVDAGEIGAGHTVTAIYELSMVDGNGGMNDPLRYQRDRKTNRQAGEVAFLKLRYKKPGKTQSQLLQWPVLRRSILSDINQASTAFRFSAAVAGLAQLLRGGQHTGEFDSTDVVALADSAREDDRFGYRSEFVALARTAGSLLDRHSRGSGDD